MTAAEEWQPVRLRDIGTVVTGSTPPAARPECGGEAYPFITPTDMDGRKRISETERWLSAEGATLLRSRLLPAGAVCVSCIGWQLGKVVMTGKASFTNQQLNSVIPHEGNDRDFLYYALSTRREEIRALGSVGTRTPILNKSVFSELSLLLPPLATQQRISYILAAIDDLIENNRRRLVLLDQMAQEIYREWFVRFRYHGHENDELVDSLLGAIPAGWRVTPFSDLGTFLNGFAFKPAHWGDAGRPIVKIRELKQGITPSTPRYGGDDLAPRYRVETGDLLFSWSAYLDAYLWASGPALLNQHLFKVAPADGVAKSWLYLALRERMDEFRSRSQGTTMKHIKRAALGEVTTVTPDASVMKAFDDVVRPILDEFLVLYSVLRPLETLRDLLLPKLVTGAIDVSHLDVDALLDETAA